MITKKMWFRSMACGCSWVPASWQGWLVTLVYAIGLIRTFVTIDRQSHSASDTLISLFPYFLLWTALLVIICYLTGEPLRRKD